MTTVLTTSGHAQVQIEVGPSNFHCRARTIVKLRGDVDITTAPALRERLLEVLRPGMRLLILDLSEVWFCDAAGLAVLIGTQRRATRLGITLCLAAPRPRVAKALHVTGLDRRLTIHPTLADAIARRTAIGDVTHARKHARTRNASQNGGELRSALAVRTLVTKRPVMEVLEPQAKPAAV
ncbi:STAS domain-containing protein [Actinoallomurus sp. NPDC050550]|uniref:STAS domain-containing protein n=1 Tax=Actinoallomurus sp. NPDC050550 TaxID=3154937 RepID=UPI0033EEFAE8